MSGVWIDLVIRDRSQCPQISLSMTHPPDNRRIGDIDHSRRSFLPSLLDLSAPLRFIVFYFCLSVTDELIAPQTKTFKRHKNPVSTDSSISAIRFPPLLNFHMIVDFDGAVDLILRDEKRSHFMQSTIKCLKRKSKSRLTSSRTVSLIRDPVNESISSFRVFQKASEASEITSSNG